MLPNAGPAATESTTTTGRESVLPLADQWQHVVEGRAPLVRYALLVVALALQATSWSTPGHFRPTSDGILAGVLVGTTVASLACAGLAVIDVGRWPLEVRRGLILAALTIAPVLLGIAIPQIGALVQATASRSPYSNDGPVMDEFAATRLLANHDPYWRVNFPYALQHNGLNLPATVSTPLMRGQFSDARDSYPSSSAIAQALYNDQHFGPDRVPSEFESHYNYPALSFLLITPFVWAGMRDLRPLYLFFLAAIACYLAWRTAPPWRYLAPLVILCDVPLLALSTGGQPDPIYAFFLVIAWGEWRSTRLSSVSLGLAIAIKQLAWFSLPFYTVLVWRREGWRKVCERLGLTGLVFGLINGPFILEGPLAYLHSLAAPMTDPMFPLGSGLIALSLAGLIPLLPRAAYAAAEGLLLLGAVVIFAGIPSRRYPSMALLLSVVPLLVAWRSLISYFYLAPILALAACLANRRLEPVEPRHTAVPPVRS